MKIITLRGGGCSTLTQLGKNQVAIADGQSTYDKKMIQTFIKYISERSNKIFEASQNIGLQESKDGLMREIKWFQLSSQFMNEIINDKKMVQENIQLILANLEVLLQAILNIIQTQQFLSYHLLKVCNLFSQFIFIFYINSPNPAMKQEKQNNYKNLLADIEKFIDFGGQNFYQNSIFYEFQVIKMCINTCPTDSTEGQELLIRTFEGIISSVRNMSPSTELLSALVDGTIYVYQKVQQQNQRKIFQILFYLERLRWTIIALIQKGVSINTIRQSLIENYNKLIKKQNQWVIKCSWIKMISELLQYTLTITKTGYEIMANKYLLNKDWNKMIELKLINTIDDNIGTITITESGEQVARIFKTWFMVFDQLKIICLNGYQDYPRFDSFVMDDMNISSEENQQKFAKILEYIDNLQINQVSRLYQNLTSDFQEYIETLNSLLEDDQDRIQQQTKVELLIILQNKLDEQIQNLVINSKIINKQLESLIGNLIDDSDESKKEKVNQEHYYLLLYNYFSIIQAIGSKDYKLPELYLEFVKYFPEIKFKESIKLLDQQNIFQKLQSQNEVKDLIIIITLLDENAQKIQQPSIQAIYLIQQYNIILCQYIDVAMIQLRSDLKDQLNSLCFFENTIINTNQVISYNKMNQKIRFNQIYFAIIKHISFIFQRIIDLISELHLNEQQIKEFKFLPNSEILLIFNSEIQLEIQQLSQQYNIDDLLQKDDQSIYQKLDNMVITLQTQKQIQQQKKEQLQNFCSQIQLYKSKFNIYIEEYGSQDQLFKQKLIQNGYSISQLIDQGYQRQDLISILDQRKSLLSNLQIEQKNNQNLIKQIQKEIKLTQTLNQEQFYDLIDQNKLSFLNKLNQSNQIIIGYLDESQKEEKHNHQYHEITLKISEVIDLIIFETNEQLKKFQSNNDTLNKQNQLIFDITNLIFEVENISEENLADFQKQFQSLIDSNQNQKFYDDKITNQLIKKNNDLIIQLPKLAFSQNQFMILDKTSDSFNEKQPFVEQSQSFQQKLQQIFLGDSWRYKEYFYFSCLYTYDIISDKNLKQQLGRIILLGKFKETDFRIKQTLKNQEYRQNIEQLINHEWDNSKETIQDQLKKKLNQLSAIQMQLQGEERKLHRETLIQQHKDLESQLEQQIKNVNEIGDVLGITIYFMKDIKRDLILIQSKLDNIVDTLNQMGQDIKFLRGKTPQQLLEIRMEQVLQNKYIQDSQSVYVQIQVKEYNFKLMKEEKQTHLFNFNQYQDGKIDEFLKQSDKITMLIHGPAGSGKSITARKIEEYLWLQYQKKVNNDVWSQNSNLIIPIFIQLPTLKEPQFMAVEETLQSSIYKFDQKQINQLLDQIQNTQIKLLFIMDSYDELSTQYQGINIIQTNKLYQWKQKNEKNHPKVITTSRSEIFPNAKYRAWFWENDQIRFDSYKEIKLQSFSLQQREEFLYQFSHLQLKLLIKDLLEIVSKKQSQQSIIEDTLKIYEQLQTNKSQQKEFLLNQQQIKQLIIIIKAHPNVININPDQEISFFKQLLIVWSQEQYQQSIKQMEIEDILDTPFMLNIVVQVLPQIGEVLSQQNYIKESFLLTYVKEKRNQLKSIVKMYNSNNQYIANKYQDQDINQLQNLLDDKSNKQITNESNQIWSWLIDSNFFKDFNVILQYQEIIKLLENVGLKNEAFQKFINQNEREFDNYIIYKALVSTKFTIYEFYGYFLDNYIEKQRIKQIYNNDIQDQNQFLIDIQQYAGKLAVAMTISNITTIEIKPQGVLFKSQSEANPFEKFFDDQDKYANYRKLIRKCLPLKQKANFHSFNHKTIQEYLFAKDIVEFIQRIDQNIDQIIKLSGSNITLEMIQFRQNLLKSSLNEINLSESKMAGTFKFIKIAIKGNKRLQEICYQLSLLSRIHENLILLSSNSLYILVNVKAIIKNKDFCKINISDTSLFGSYFKKCDFSDSKFLRVNLNGINLSDSDLSRINWKDIQTNDLPIYKADLKILDACYSNDGKHILGCGQQGMIWMWERQSSLLINSIKLHDGDVIYIGQTSNNDIITFGKDEKNFNLKIWNNEYKFLGQPMSEVDEFFSTIKHKLSKFSHNDKYIANFNGNKSVVVHTIMDSQLFFQFDLNDSSETIQIMKNEDLIFTMSQTSWKITIWDLQQYQTQIIQVPTQIYNIHWQINFSQNCQSLILFDGRYDDLYLFNLDKQKLCHHNFKQMNNFTLTSDNKYLICNNQNRILIYDSETFVLLSAPQSGHQETISSIKFDKEQTEMITTSHDCTIKPWNLKMILDQNQTLFDGRITEVQYSPDGMLLYYCKETQRSLFIVDINTGEQIDQINQDFDGFRICISGRFVYFIISNLFAYYDLKSKQFNKIIVFRIIGSNDLMQFQDCRLFQVHSKDIKKSSFSHIILLNNDMKVKNLSKFTCSHAQIQYSQNSQFLYYLSAQDDKQINTKSINYNSEDDKNFLKDLTEPQYIHNERIIQFVIKSDDKFMISSGQSNTYVWNTESNELVFQLPIIMESLVISKTINQYLIIFDKDKISFYETEKYQQVGQQSRFNEGLAVPSPIKHQFITIGTDGILKLWNVNKQLFSEKNFAFIEGIAIPKNMKQGTSLNNVKWDSSKIVSEQQFELQNIWSQKAK